MRTIRASRDRARPIHHYRPADGACSPFQSGGHRGFRRDRGSYRHAPHMMTALALTFLASVAPSPASAETLRSNVAFNTGIGKKTDDQPPNGLQVAYQITLKGGELDGCTADIIETFYPRNEGAWGIFDISGKVACANGDGFASIFRGLGRHGLPRCGQHRGRQRKWPLRERQGARRSARRHSGLRLRRNRRRLLRAGRRHRGGLTPRARDREASARSLAGLTRAPNTPSFLRTRGRPLLKLLNLACRALSTLDAAVRADEKGSALA